jgi:hypothetical protein
MEIKITHQEVVDLSTDPALLDTIGIPEWARGNLRTVAGKLTQLDEGHGVKVLANPFTAWVPVPTPLF